MTHIGWLLMPPAWATGGIPVMYTQPLPEMGFLRAVSPFDFGSGVPQQSYRPSDATFGYRVLSNLINGKP
jgi:hypothetical protein